MGESNTPPTNASASSTTNYVSGTRAFRDGDWKTAVTEYTNAIEVDPQNVSYYSNRSAAYVKLGCYTEAIADAETCIRLEPQSSKGYGRKGSALIAMQNYEEAIAAYTEGLRLSSSDEESLRMGLQAAEYAQRETSKVHRAVQRTRTVRQSSVATQKKAQSAKTASGFVAETRRQIKLEMAALQAQLDLLAELEDMTDDQKVGMLFSLIDKKVDNKVDASELADALRLRNKSLSLNDAIERAIRMVAAFDNDGDTMLDFKEFRSCIEATRQELDITLGEFAEFMALQLTFADDYHGLESANTSGTTGGAFASQDGEVREQEEWMTILTDPRLQQLFRLFDKDGRMELSFKDVAAGLYRLSHSMEESSRTTMGLLFMLDKDVKRTLDYEQFGRLVMAVVASSNAPFDQVVDDLVFALEADDQIPESELQALYITDSIYNEVLDLKNKEHGVNNLMDPLVYGKIQRLFDVWDTDSDGYVGRAELMAGLRHFHDASHGEGNPEEDAARLIEFDDDGDNLLNRLDFARALGTFAQATEKNLHDMIDFMMVTTPMGEKQTNSYKRAFRHSVSMDAAAMALKNIKNADVED